MDHMTSVPLYNGYNSTLQMDQMKYNTYTRISRLLPFITPVSFLPLVALASFFVLPSSPPSRFDHDASINLPLRNSRTCCSCYSTPGPQGHSTPYATSHRMHTIMEPWFYHYLKTIFASDKTNLCESQRDGNPRRTSKDRLPALSF